MIYPGLNLVSPRLLLLNYASCPFSSVANLSKKTILDGAKKRSSLSRLLRVTRTQSGRISAGLAFLMVSSGVTLSVPYWLGILIDQATKANKIPGSDMAKSPLLENLYQSKVFGNLSNLFSTNLFDPSCLTKNLFVIIFLVLSTGAFCNAMRVYMFKTAGYRIGNRLRNAIFQSIVHNRTYSQFNRLSAKTGDLSSRLNADVNIMSNCSSQVISDIFRSISQLGLGLGMMLHTSSDLTFMSCLAIPPMMLMGKLQGNLLQETSRKTTEQLGNVIAFASERFYNLREVHASGKNAEECNTFSQLNKELAVYNTNEAKARSIFFGMTGFVGNIIILGMIGYGGNLVQNNVISIGQLGSYLMYSGYVGVSISRISTAYSELMKGLASSDRIWQIITLDEFIQASQEIPIKKYSDEFVQKFLTMNPENDTGSLIKFDNVSFKYPQVVVENTHDILSDINFELKQGEILAITGLSGSGKTSIMSLLLKLFEPDQGKIYWNGYDISELENNFIRNYLISPVLQENVLFNGSILDNIIYGNIQEEIDTIRLENVCKAAQITNFTTRGGKLNLNYQVGERGNNLSGGQRQRVLIARALYKKCPLIIFDEATSAMDANTENELFHSLKEFKNDESVSIITIAHRKATLESADRILILGKKSKEDVSSTILASGSFSELGSMIDRHGLVDKIGNRNKTIPEKN